MSYHDEESVIAAVLENPAAPSLVARLQSALEVERLRRQQFYADMDDSQKTEFINGEVVIHSPVKKQNGDVSGFLFKLIDTFVRTRKLGHVGHEKIMISLSRNDYEPDLIFFNSEKSQHFNKEQWKFPAPEFAVEILSDSTQAVDRGVKFDDYAAHGIGEYWIIDPKDESLEQYLLTGKEYQLNLKAHKGTVESIAIPGFTMDIRALFDETVNMSELKRILA